MLNAVHFISPVQIW